MNPLEQLKRHTVVVADTGNFKQMAQFAPRDATTNPSLILKAVQSPDYAPLLEQTVREAAGQPLDVVIDRVLVRFGLEILSVVPGRVSTEVDARLSFDRDATVARARRLMAMYEAQGVGRDRVLIKIAATWEGMQAAAELEREGIHCNLTLLFSFCQAVVCGDVGVRLISPFVGRIYDWARKAAGAQWDEAAMSGVNDPGVRSVTQIYRYYKRMGIETEVMGASFRNIGQILALAGCDLLTISPELLAQLQSADRVVEPHLDAAAARTLDLQRVHFDEAGFRRALNEDAMATDKLAEGIRAFAADSAKLDAMVQALMATAAAGSSSAELNAAAGAMGSAVAGSGAPTRRGDQTPAWAALRARHQGPFRTFALRKAFEQAPDRFDRYTLTAPGVFADLSKNLWGDEERAALLQLARDCELEARRDALLRGEPVNHTEGRAVLHTALRQPRGQGAHSAEVHEVLDRLLAYAESIRDTAHSGIRDVVNIGIGGSDLGPQMAVVALDDHVHRGLRFHFVSNVDGHDLSAVLRHLQPQSTLFIVASKTFTTQETLANAQAAKDWFLAQGGTDVSRHFVGVTTNLQAAAAFGVTTTFGFWDWVGGRYSMWGAIGLPIAIALGEAGFRAFLQGAHEMDRHFAEAPLERNLPIQLGLLDVWYRNFLGFASRSVAPYHQNLRRLPAYLQQLEMESNGKCVDLDGQPLSHATSPVIWGEPGTNGQHAYFQMLHQGTDVIPVEFIAVRLPSHGLADMHRKLLANCLAQGQALMLGKTTAEAATEKAPTASASLPAGVVARHRTFPGNRPSSTFILERLDPFSLGAFISMMEHRVFTSAAVWGINAYDQWGVELGKALCNQLLPRLETGDTAGLDGSTAGLLRRLA